VDDAAPGHDGQRPLYSPVMPAIRRPLWPARGEEA